MNNTVYKEKETFTYTNISALGYPNFQKWCDLRGFHCRGIEKPDFPEGQPDFAYIKDREGGLHRTRTGIICVETKLTSEEVIDIEAVVGRMRSEDIT